MISHIKNISFARLSFARLSFARLSFSGLFFILGITLSAASNAALTLKSGEVLGSDGNVYKGASPKEKAAIIERAERTEKSAGVFGNQIYVVSGETVTFVPIKDVVGKTDESIKELVGDAVVQQVTGIEGLRLETIEEAQELAAETGVPLPEALVEKIAEEALEAAERAEFEPLVAAQAQKVLEQISGSTQFDLSALDATKEQLAAMIADIDEQALSDLQEMAKEIERVEVAAAEAAAAHEAVSAPGGLLDQFNSGEISEQELMEQSQGMAGFEGHCESDCN